MYQLSKPNFIWLIFFSFFASLYKHFNSELLSKFMFTFQLISLNVYDAKNPFCFFFPCLGMLMMRNAATKAIQKLIEIQETKSLLQDELIGTCEEEQHESQNKRASDSSRDDGRISSADEVSIDESEAAVNTQTITLYADSSSVDCFAREAFEEEKWASS